MRSSQEYDAISVGCSPVGTRVYMLYYATQHCNTVFSSLFKWDK